KLRRGFAAYERNTGTAHPFNKFPEVIERAAEPATGSLLLSGSEFSDYWFGLITIGSQPFTVVIDTGTSELVVPSIKCGNNCKGHRRYDPKKSHTAQDLSKTFNIQAVSGETISGEQYTDGIGIGGLKAPKQTFGAATEYSFDMTHFQADGIMGMGFKESSALKAPSVFQTLVQGRVVVDSVFGLKLSKSGSELFLGGLNHALFVGDITWLSLVAPAAWAIIFDDISVAGHQVVGRTKAIFSTGSAQIIGTPAGIANLFTKIKGAKPSSRYGGGVYTIPCNFNTPISITLGGKQFVISPSSFVRHTETFNECIANAVAHSNLPNGAVWLLGDAVLRNMYTVWDVGNRRIGFATLKS
ncbi:aspartic peptidase domain-containing protein, partial [Lactifluus volemus]